MSIVFCYCLFNNEVPELKMLFFAAFALSYIRWEMLRIDFF